MNFRDFARMVNEQMEVNVLMQHFAILYLQQNPGVHYVGEDDLDKTGEFAVGINDEGNFYTAQLIKPDLKTFGEARLKVVENDADKDS